MQSPHHCLGRSPANLMERLSDLQQSIFSLPSESHDKLLSGNCLTVQRLGVASQQEEESGLMVTPSALARNDSMILRSRSTLNLVDSSPAVQLGPQSAELRHPGATRMGSQRSRVLCYLVRGDSHRETCLLFSGSTEVT